MVPPCSDRISRVPPYSRIHLHFIRTGLSPTMAQLSRRFRFDQKNYWPSPRSLATTSGVSIDVLSFGYLDVSVPRVRFFFLCIQKKILLIDNGKSETVAGRRLTSAVETASKFPLPEVGFPIRISTDQSLFATPRGFSQRITSFIAS